MTPPVNLSTWWLRACAETPSGRVKQFNNDLESRLRLLEEREKQGGRPERWN